METSLRYEQTLALGQGESAKLAGWEITLDRMASSEGPNWYSDRAYLTARKGGATARLEPEKRFYPAARMPTTETAIHKTPFGDLYAALGEQRIVDGRPFWTFRVYFNPLIDLVFLGVLLMALGGGLSVVGARQTRRSPEEEAVSEEARPAIRMTTTQIEPAE